MNFDKAMTWDKYTHQKLKSEFCNALSISILGDDKSRLSEEGVKNCVRVLGEKLGEFICKQGYKPSEKADIIIKVPSKGPTADPTNPFATVGGKVDCNLTATKDQYVMYASEIIDELKQECKRQIEYTWRDRLLTYLQSKFDEKFPYFDGADSDERDIIDRFTSKRDELMTKIEKLIDSFQIPDWEDL